MIVEKYADKINKELIKNNPAYKFDIILILAIVSFIINAIRLWIECGREDEPSANQGWFARKLLERKARQALAKHNLDRSLAPLLVKEALEQLKNTSKEDLQKLIIEARK